MNILKTTGSNDADGLVVGYVNYISVKLFLKNILTLKLPCWGLLQAWTFPKGSWKWGRTGKASVPCGAAVFSPRSEVTT